MAITGKTKLMGVIGYPVTHTASPVMHQAAYEYLGCDYAYVPLEVKPELLGEAIAGIRALSFMGVNVTIPYKETVMPFLDEIDPQAQKIGAVNTIVNREGRLIGYNTDGAGFLYALEQEGQFNMADKSVVILGAGGAAKGIAFHCLHAKSLCIVNRSVDKAKVLAESLPGELKIRFLSSESVAVREALQTADLVINTTPLGMSPYLDASPLDNYESISAKTFCCDIIYKPTETVFLKESKARGAQVLGGAGMLAGQGMLAFALFTGQNVPYSVMRKALQ